MSTIPGRAWFDPLQIFAVSVAGLIAALLFLTAVLADVSVSTAATRAVIGWGVLSMLGIALTMVVRWVLRAPTAPAPGTRLDVTLPSDPQAGPRVDGRAV